MAIGVSQDGGTYFPCLVLRALREDRPTRGFYPPMASGQHVSVVSGGLDCGHTFLRNLMSGWGLDRL